MGPSSVFRLEEKSLASKIDIKDSKVVELQERLSARRAGSNIFVLIDLFR